MFVRLGLVLVGDLDRVAAVVGHPERERAGAPIGAVDPDRAVTDGGRDDGHAGSGSRERYLSDRFLGMRAIEPGGGAIVPEAAICCASPRVRRRPGGGAMPTEFVVSFAAMETFFREPGERGWVLEGAQHGLAATSVIVTDTAPGGGPPLHTHPTEEVHVLLRGRLRYAIDEHRFEAVGPCAVMIPARAPHTFANAGEEPVSLVCFFPSAELWSTQERVGPNPLLD
jgi:quercetin dioxygenase-like cupin family protein